MKKFSPALSPERICQITGAAYRGDPGISLDKVGEPAEAGAGSLVFFEQEKLFDTVSKSSADAVICTAEAAERLAGRNLFISPRPYFALMSLVGWWLKQAPPPSLGADPRAKIDPSAKLGEGVSVGAFSTLGKNVSLGDRTQIGENCQIGDNVTLGANCRLHPNVVIYEDCVLGDGVTVHSGVVIGADGFGFLLLDGKQQKIPQIGNVVIGNDVEIGANTTIDRATLGSTVIGEGTKIDNLVQIGHNCRIGRHSILCAQVGLAGSTIVGDYVYLAGQVGVAGHLTIGDRAMIGAQSGVSNDIPADSRYFGYPAMDANLMKRIAASQKHLPDMYRHYLKQTRTDKGEDQ